MPYAPTFPDFFPAEPACERGTPATAGRSEAAHSGQHGLAVFTQANVVELPSRQDVIATFARATRLDLDGLGMFTQVNVLELAPRQDAAATFARATCLDVVGQQQHLRICPCLL